MDLLVEFGSAVDAVECAVSVAAPKKMGDLAHSAAPTIVLRVGINVGDIDIEENDIFGDSANIAARIEAECEPGVFLSSIAFDHVKGKTLIDFEKSRRAAS